jgi:hypothetical protein
MTSVILTKALEQLSGPAVMAIPQEPYIDSVSDLINAIQKVNRVVESTQKCPQFAVKWKKNKGTDFNSYVNDLISGISTSNNFPSGVQKCMNLTKEVEQAMKAWNEPAKQGEIMRAGDVSLTIQELKDLKEKVDDSKQEIRTAQCKLALEFRERDVLLHALRTCSNQIIQTNSECVKNTCKNTKKEISAMQCAFT